MLIARSDRVMRTVRTLDIRAGDLKRENCGNNNGLSWCQVYQQHDRVVFDDVAQCRTQPGSGV